MIIIIVIILTIMIIITSQLQNIFVGICMCMWISEKKMGIPERTMSIKPTTLFVDAAKYNTHVAAFGARACYTFMYQKGSSIKYTVETTERVQRYRGNSYISNRVIVVAYLQKCMSAQIRRGRRQAAKHRFWTFQWVLNAQMPQPLPLHLASSMTVSKVHDIPLSKLLTGWSTTMGICTPVMLSWRGLTPSLRSGGLLVFLGVNVKLAQALR